MRKLLYKVAQSLYFRKLLPMCIWSPIYDRWHKLFDIDKKYCKRYVLRKGVRK